jgi:hypothetical protein
MSMSIPPDDVELVLEPTGTVTSVAPLEPSVTATIVIDAGGSAQGAKVVKVKVELGSHAP